MGVRARVQQAGEVAVEALVARDELVGEGEAVHEAALLEPEDGAEGAAEEDALHAPPGHQPRRERGVAGRSAHHNAYQTMMMACLPVLVSLTWEGNSSQPGMSFLGPLSTEEMVDAHLPTHFRAQSALRLTAGTVSTAWNSLFFSLVSLM